MVDFRRDTTRVKAGKWPEEVLACDKHDDQKRFPLYQRVVEEGMAKRVVVGCLSFKADHLTPTAKMEQNV